MSDYMRGCWLIQEISDERLIKHPRAKVIFTSMLYMPVTARYGVVDHQKKAKFPLTCITLMMIIIVKMFEYIVQKQ